MQLPIATESEMFQAGNENPQDKLLAFERNQVLTLRYSCAVLDRKKQTTVLDLVSEEETIAPRQRRYALILLCYERKRDRISETKMQNVKTLMAYSLEHAKVHTLFEVNAMPSCLISVENTSDQDISYTELKRAMRKIYEELNLKLWFAISDWQSAHAEIGWMYQEAMVIHDICTSHQSCICTLQTVREKYNGVDVDPRELPEYERNLMNCVFQHDFHRAAEFFDNIMRISINESPLMMTLQIMISTVHTRLSQVLNWLGITINPREQPDSYASAFRQLYQVESFDALTEYTHDFFALLEDTIDRTSYRHKAEAIGAYIQDNYTNANLCAQQICDYFLISKSYLSKLMNDEFNSSLTDYIHGVRVAHAAELLANTDVSVSEIQELVGYTNRNTMHRAFIKMTGMSPSEYRKRKHI